jgi:drug/metabolite transporter (DMT)-like permease
MSVRRQGQAVILVAAILWSTAGIGQRGLDATAATQVAGRALFAALTLLAAVAVLERAGTLRAFRTMGRWGLAFAVLMAVSSGTFMLSLNHTTVANVLFMQAASPMLAAALGWALLCDPVGRRTALAIAVAAVGVAVMVAGSVESGFFGTLLPFVMTASFAGVVVIARHRSEVSMLPGTCLSQVLVLAVAAPFATLGAVDGRDWAVLAALGVFQMGTALMLLTVGARLIAPAEVALISLVEVVLGPLWVWLVYDEEPSAATLVGGTIVLVAVVIQATSRTDGVGREPVDVLP